MKGAPKGQLLQTVLRVDWVADGQGGRQLNVTTQRPGNIGFAAAPLADYIGQHPEVFGADVAAAGKLLYETIVAAAGAHATGTLEKGEV